MERKIGEIFNIDNEWYQVVKSNGECCKGCAFYEKGCKAKYADVGNCGTSREDWTQVIFKKLEKVGEPYINNDRTYQLYKLPMNIEKLPPHTEGINLVRFDIVEIEIKQTKEDMEEKKLNLKPFDLDATKQGKPVCTRDGRKARILCYDFKQNEEYPILVAVENKDGKECALLYSNDGISEMYKSSNNELAILPERKEGWVNIYKSDNGTYYTGAIFYEKNDALVNTAEIEITTGIPRDCIDTINISWEE